MAHQVEKMFSVREAPWHLAQTADRTAVLDRAPDTWAEVRTLAGLDWDPVEEMPYRRRKETVSGQEVITYEPVPAHKWIVRSDTQEVLDNALSGYELITNTDMGDIFETMRQGHDMFYETGGCLDEGRRVWLMLQMGDFLEIPGDPSPTARYLALLNRHDGHGSCKAIATNVRIVCANTWHMADADSSKSLACFSFHHRANWRQHMKELQADVQQALLGATKELDEYAEMATEMAAMSVTSEQEERFIDEFIFDTRDEHKLKPKSRVNVDTSRMELRALLESRSCEGIRGTAYGLMQAAGEWADHCRAYKTTDTYLNRTVFTAEARKLRARRLALAAADSML